MKVLILKGSQEIGGTAIQLTSGTCSILLDAGLPLTPNSRPVDLAALSVDALLVSHSHQDHFGLMETLAPGTPVYMGELGRNLIDATQIFLGRTPYDCSFRNFKPWQPFTVGPFTITAYLMDHSAADAYAFLVEAEGKRIFYSGDLRAHGRKRKLFEHLVTHPPKKIDLLLLEGTMMRRSNNEFLDETAVEKKIFEVIHTQQNISFLLGSSQNIDRIVSAFRACRRARKTLVIDIYTAWVLQQVHRVSPAILGMEWPECRVYLGHTQHEALKEDPERFASFRHRMYPHRITKEELTAQPADFLYFGKMSSYKLIDIYRNPQHPVGVIYSQWLGYLNGSYPDYFGSAEIAAYRSDPGIHFVYAHTSGHAPVQDLQRLATALKPRMLVPIHTEHGNDFQNAFQDVRTLQDGEELTLD